MKLPSKSRTRSISAPEPPNSELIRLAAPLHAGAESPIARCVDRLPPLSGAPISVTPAGGLHVRAHKLRHGPGDVAVHAGSDLRLRMIHIDESLLSTPFELCRILTHEVFHFVWYRLGNPRRRNFGELIAGEFDAGAGGELGWSAEHRKAALSRLDRRNRTRKWREYACESFCDTAGWLFAGQRRHEEFTLETPYRGRRQEWFRNFLKGSQRITI